MKIFWSWQSDTPGNTGRHFVRGALNEAIKQLREPDDVEEPDDAARREQLHVDADREGVPGSPDLARLILQKIAASAVVVADVTPIGFGSTRKNKDGKELPPNALMNPNVAIELGYAMGRLPENSFLMVLNTHYGERGTMPFDLAHKGGPLMYNLPPDASKKKIKEEHAKLRGQFTVALRQFLRAAQPQGPAFQEIPTTTNASAFWLRGEVLIQIEDTFARLARNATEVREYRFDETQAFYLRIIPTVPLVEPLKYALLEKAAQKRPRVLTQLQSGAMCHRNGYGAIIYDTSNEHALDGFAQLFRNGEVWAVSRIFFRIFNGTRHIALHSVQDIYVRTLVSLLQVINKNIGIVPPYRIEMGAVGLKGARLALGNHQISPIIHQTQAKTSCVLNTIDDDSIGEVVNAFREDLLDIAVVS